MADEQKTVNENTATQNNAGDENTSTQTDGQVQMTQEQLNTLISQKYAKGAEKAKSELLESLGIDSVDTLKTVIQKQKEAEEASKTELEKMQEALKKAEEEKQKLLNESLALKTKTEVINLATKSGVKDVEVFEMIYNQASKNDGFEQNKLIESLKVERPYLFEKSVIKTDSSSNNTNTPLDFAQRVKMAKTQKELDALYAELQ